MILRLSRTVLGQFFLVFPGANVMKLGDFNVEEFFVSRLRV